MKEMSFKSGVKGRVICGENGFIFNAFINLEPVQRSEDGCDIEDLGAFNHSMCARQFWIPPLYRRTSKLEAFVTWW